MTPEGHTAPRMEGHSMNKPPVAVLLSGGMDSTTALAHALTDADPARSLGIFVDYGQRHIVERDAARQVAEWYGVNLVTLDLTGYGASVSSALTDPNVKVPHGEYGPENMALTVVPNRNATMLSAAAGVCAQRGIRHLYTAVHAGDHEVYADCRPDFIEALSRATVLSCGVEIMAPFVYMDKAQIARHGANRGVPYALTWSCYEGGIEHCGKCGTCIERYEAFRDAGLDDPTRYARSSQ